MFKYPQTLYTKKAKKLSIFIQNINDALSNMQRYIEILCLDLISKNIIYIQKRVSESIHMSIYMILFTHYDVLTFTVTLTSVFDIGIAFSGGDSGDSGADGADGTIPV